MKKIFLLLYIGAMLTACNKVDIKAPDDFTVTTSATTYSIRDTVKFNFTGNPDQITFYSGEPNRSYANAGRTNAQPDSTILTFSTATTAASATTQPVSANNVAVLASTDYSGALDVASVKKASWTDITARAKFATTTTAVPSGNVHLEDLAKGSNRLYIAFKYMADTATATSMSRKWTISTLSIKTYFKDTTNIIAGNVQAAGLSNILSVLNPTNTWAFANTSLTFNAPAVGSSKDEDWAISRLMDQTVISSDIGVNLKNTTALLSQYKYSFRKPGTYVVTFVGQNVSSNGQAQTIRQITLNITN